MNGYPRDQERSLETRILEFSINELLDLIRSFQKKFKKVRRENAQIQEQFGKRTVEEILESGETFYMGACIDATLAFLFKLKEKHPQSEHLQLKCEILRWKTNNNQSIHFFIEDHSVTPCRVIDFVGGNDVKIYGGLYQNPKAGEKIDSLGIRSMKADEIEPTDNLLSLAPKLSIPLGEDALQIMLKKYQKDNTLENFQEFQKNQDFSVSIDFASFKRQRGQEKIGKEILDSLNLQS